MIGWGDVYKVLVAIFPLYSALALGYGSVRWWHIFTSEQCDAINRLVGLFTIPFFTFEFTVHADPFAMNLRLLAADAVSKFLIAATLLMWVRLSPTSRDEEFAWPVTVFSLSTLTNTLVLGLPLLKAMYGQWAQSLIVQVSVVQGILWVPLLLLVLELRKARNKGRSLESQPKDRVQNGDCDGMAIQPSFKQLAKTVLLKVALNPNTYASIFGISWAFVATRWGLKMPSIIEDSILVMSRAGAGTAMFSLGLFMALQENLVACGPKLTAIGMLLRFAAGPAAMVVSALAVGLRGDILRVAIVQAALPQSITSFILAREYGLHAEVLSTAVIFGMLVALPLLVMYYVLLGMI